MTKKIPDMPNCFYRVSAKALILDDQKRFLLTLENKGWWELPGGGIDFGEKPTESLVREIKEEMGLEVANINEQPSYFLTSLNTNTVLSKNGIWFCNVIYEATVKDLNFTPSDECVELRFFTKEEALKENLFCNVVEFVKMFNPENHGAKNEHRTTPNMRKK